LYDAFISYASGDFALAEKVFEGLTRAGFRVWFDRARLRPGFDWHSEIETACEASLVMLPLLTPRWRASPWACYETHAHESIIPLLLEGDIETVGTPPLRRFHAYRVDAARILDHDWSPLVEELRAKSEQLEMEASRRVTKLAAERPPGLEEQRERRTRTRRRSRPRSCRD